MDMLEGLQKFFASYPFWARVLAGTGLAITFFTLVLVPRGSSRPHSSSGTDAWLIIRGVEIFGRYPGAQVKVTAIVNDTKYLYPSVGGVEWLGVGPTMAPQQFKLPRPGPDGYEIRFEMLLREADVLDRTRSFTSVKSVFVKTLPFDGDYEVHLFEEGVRGPGVEGRVRFSVTTDPNI
jgi:hypothetical protein